MRGRAVVVEHPLPGVTVRYMREGSRLAPPLEEGEEVQLVEGGPWQRVVRVTGTAAYVQSARVVTVEIGERTFEAREGGSQAVSRCAFVYARRAQ